MLGRILGAGLWIALAGCYSPPEPYCGFTCGPNGECPPDYTCNPHRVCQANSGAPAANAAECPGPVDAAIDGANFSVGATSPADAASGVPVDQVVTASLDRDVDGVSTSTFYLLQQGTTHVAGTASYSLGSFHMRLVPALQLAPTTTYTAVIANGITEHLGTATLTPVMWSFATGADTVAPHLASSMPFDNEANVPTTTTVTLVFDEAVTGVDTTSVSVTAGVTPVAGAISSTDTHTYVFTPTAPLTAATAYTVALTNAIQDSYSNALAPLSFTFTTQ